MLFSIYHVNLCEKKLCKNNNLGFDALKMEMLRMLCFSSCKMFSLHCQKKPVLPSAYENHKSIQWFHFVIISCVVFCCGLYVCLIFREKLRIQYQMLGIYLLPGLVIHKAFKRKICIYFGMWHECIFDETPCNSKFPCGFYLHTHSHIYTNTYVCVYRPTKTLPKNSNKIV